MNKIQLHKGQRVKFIDDVGDGVVTKILANNKVMVEDESGFENMHDISELLIVPGHESEEESYDLRDSDLYNQAEEETMSENIKEHEKTFKQLYTTRQERKGDFMEVDLHIHELVDSNIGMDNGDIVEVQMAHFVRMLELAINKKFPKIVFIHGVGQGTLKRELRNTLRAYPNVSFHDANYKEYGAGATEVLLHRN